jgi:hypothetical protein
MAENQSRVVVARFDDPKEAEDALRIMNKALRDESKTIYQGALVSLRRNGSLRVRDFKDIGLGDLVMSTADLTVDVGVQSAKIALTALLVGAGLLLDGLRLVKNSASRAIGLAGVTLSLPSRRDLADFTSGDELQSLSVGLEPGDTAVVVVADHDTAGELATKLAQSGGTLV